MSEEKKVKSLADIKVDVAALRSQLVELMKEGVSEIPLDSLLIYIKETCIIRD